MGLTPYSTSPTPFAIWNSVLYTEWMPLYSNFPTSFPTRYEATDCGKWITSTFIKYTSAGWVEAPQSVLLPYTGYIDTPGPRDDDLYWNSFPAQVSPGTDLPSFANALPTALPNDGVYLAIPTDAWKSMGSNSAILKQFPDITNCWTQPAIGEPTVHVAVAQLTGTSDHTITMSKALYSTSTTTMSHASATTSATYTEGDQTTAGTSTAPESLVVHSSATQVIDTVEDSLPVSTTSPASTHVKSDVTSSSPTAAPVQTLAGTTTSAVHTTVSETSQPSADTAAGEVGSVDTVLQPTGVISESRDSSALPAIVAADSNIITVQPLSLIHI